MKVFNRGYGRYTGMRMTYQLSAQNYRALYGLATLPVISREAKKRLGWMDYYRRCGNARQTCRYFGISPKTFYLWKKRYHPYHLESLENRSQRPRRTRQWQVSREQELRILGLRRKYIRYGKEKLRVLYQKQYGAAISSWKIQRVIEKHNLYYSPIKTKKLREKRQRNQPKKRITELKRELRTGFLVALDAIVIYWAGLKRYILTGIDVHSKIAFARMYPGKHSRHAKDFLLRLNYLLENKIENLTRDNGSEFQGEFAIAVQGLRIGSFYSRPKTPTDNSYDERFNRTLRDEFIALGNMTADCPIFNRQLTDWLIEYNFHRPHQSLDYETPVEFHYKHHKVLPMYPASTSI